MKVSHFGHGICNFGGARIPTSIVAVFRKRQHNICFHSQTFIVLKNDKIPCVFYVMKETKDGIQCLIRVKKKTRGEWRTLSLCSTVLRNFLLTSEKKNK